MLQYSNRIIHYRDTNHPVKYNPTIVNSLDIPDNSKDFLMNIGVALRPEKNTVLITKIHTDLPHISDIIGDEELDQECNNFHVYAEYFDHTPRHFYCIEVPTGKTYAVLRDLFSPKFKPVLFNSDIICNIEYILILDEYLNWLLREKVRQGTSDRNKFKKGVLMNSVSQTIQKLRECDPVGCAEADQYLLQEDLDPGELLFAKCAWSQVVVRLAKKGYWY